jgi:S1-C subfamily serine protease
MRKKNLLMLLICVIGLSSCASIWIPNKQRIEITTNSPNATIYADNEEIGNGKDIIVKIKRNGALPVVLQDTAYKNEYCVIVPTGRPIAYYPLTCLNVLFIFPNFDYVAFYADAYNPKCLSYPKVNKLTFSQKYVNKLSDDKYVDLSAIKLDISDIQKDFKYYDVKYSSENLAEEIAKSEKSKDKDYAKLEKKSAKNKKNKLEDDNKIKFDDTKFSINVYKTLKKTGYIDTINRVFPDNNNSIELEGVVKSGKVYTITSKYQSYYKAKLDLKWYIKNTYEEIVDSVKISEYSGDFAPITGKDRDDMFYKMYADAVENSYFKLIKDPVFKKYSKVNTNLKISDSQMILAAPKEYVREPSDAMAASVIVKRKDKGHGSGFAITNDGYIITNYHVIAGKTPKKQEELTVVLSTGEELPVTIVRFNAMQDIALLKVDKKFEKPFRLQDNKSFKLLQDVYTIGAPKSIELGQSISSGLISNERNLNNNSLLQLNMSVNAGNSGGPLFDKSGVLHGVVKSKLVGFSVEGIGFAIPSYLIPSYLNITIKK